MSQGVLYNLAIGARATYPFKRLRTRITAGKIDRSSKLNPTGSVNVGFTSTTGDLKTVFCSCYELLGDNNGLGDMMLYVPGVPYTAAWAISYNGVVIASGSAFYYSETDLDGSVPGDASGEFHFESDGPFSITGIL